MYPHPPLPLVAPPPPPHPLAGWAGWLAQQAVARNPQVKLMLTLYGLPGWLAASGSSDPFSNPTGVASYVSNFIAGFQTAFAVTVGYVGVYSTPTSTVTASMGTYITTLRSTLDGAGLTGVKIVCADASDWSCADAAAANPTLAAAVGVVGNAGTTLPASGSVATLGKPAWSTSFGKHVSTTAGAIGAVVDLVSGYVGSGGVLGGFIYSYGVTAAPYGWPHWHTGLIQASQPWSGHYYLSPSLWAVAHVNQFLKPSSTWKGTLVGHGAGQLTAGGWYMSWADVTSGTPGDFVLLAAKFNSADGDSTADEAATFTLGGNLAGKFEGRTLTVWYSNFGYEANGVNMTLFAPYSAATVAVTNNQFTVSEGGGGSGEGGGGALPPTARPLPRA